MNEESRAPRSLAPRPPRCPPNQSTFCPRITQHQPKKSPAELQALTTIQQNNFTPPTAPCVRSNNVNGMRNPAPINHFPPTLFSPNGSTMYGEAHLFSQADSRLVTGNLSLHRQSVHRTVTQGKAQQDSSPAL
jgi:hypothetical protein